MALREDYGPGDSTDLWTHFNNTNKGVNQIGQTARYWFRAGRWTNPDKEISESYPSGANIAPDFNLAGGMYARATTMTNPPVRAANGRRFTIPDGGPYRVTFHANWAMTSMPSGYVWASIQLNGSDAGQNQIGSLSGTMIAERAAAARMELLDPSGADSFVGATAEVSIEYDFEPGETFMAVTRQVTGANLGLRFHETWTSLTVTRIGH